jgi:hypothetical protein
MIPLVCSVCLSNLPQEYQMCDNDCGRVYCSDSCWGIDYDHHCVSSDSSSGEEGEEDDDS